MKTTIALPIDEVLTARMLQFDRNVEKKVKKVGIDVVYLRVNELVNELVSGNVQYAFCTTVDGTEYSSESEEYFKVRELNVRDDRRLIILGKETTQISEWVCIITPYPNCVKKILIRKNGWNPLDKIDVYSREEDRDQIDPDYYRLPEYRMQYETDWRTRLIDLEKWETKNCKERTFFASNKIGIFSSLPLPLTIQ